MMDRLKVLFINYLIEIKNDGEMFSFQADKNCYWQTKSDKSKLCFVSYKNLSENMRAGDR